MTQRQLTDQQYRLVLLYLVVNRPLTEATQVSELFDEGNAAAELLLNSSTSEAHRNAVGFDPTQIVHPFAISEDQAMQAASAIAGWLLRGPTILEKVMFSLPPTTLELLGTKERTKRRMLLTTILGAEVAEQIIHSTEEVLQQ